MATSGPGVGTSGPEPAAEVEPHRSSFRRVRAAAAVAGGVVAFVIWAFVTLVFSSYLFVDSEGDHSVAIPTVWLLTGLVPPVLLWVRLRRVRRWFAAGMAAGLALVLVATVSAVLWEVLGNPSTRAAERSLRGIAATASSPVYYLGPTFNGWELEDAGLVNDPPGASIGESFDRGAELSLTYGSTCGVFASGTCGAELEVDIDRFSVFDPSRLRSEDCAPMPPIRGVPVVVTREGIVAFVGDLTVTILDPRVDNLDRKAIGSLRLVGELHATYADLPAPPVRAIRLIAAQCR